LQTSIFWFISLGMNNFAPEYFFDLSNFAHAELFNGCTYAWEALPRIKDYLKKASLGKIEVDVPHGTYLVHPELISIGQGTVLEPGAYIRGPCIIGENCTVRHGAYIRGDFIAGNGCVIGHDTESKNAVMLDKAQAGHFAYLGDTIVGNRVNLGAGTICANLKLDHKTIVVRFENQTFDTGLKKFGAIIGDDSQTGCNSVTNPGTLMGKQVFCYPCSNFGGFVASKQVIRPSSKVIISPL
jgi:UDP-N-acetylglucosamine diphosphorylase / glucose-1-phosphate thymidylyltransferase / UDP-N-acetylgalactosamine diphosphorylase / glucosamine-1-phosphate N-acetyltransferase / galactosamine-1-phosphate N-acetyltransferase